MLMALINGPMLQFPWAKSNNQHIFSSAATKQDPIKGALMITVGCFCWAGFIILQVSFLINYKSEHFHVRQFGHVQDSWSLFPFKASISIDKDAMFSFIGVSISIDKDVMFSFIGDYSKIIPC